MALRHGLDLCLQGCASKVTIITSAAVTRTRIARCCVVFKNLPPRHPQCFYFGHYIVSWGKSAVDGSVHSTGVGTSMNQMSCPVWILIFTRVVHHAITKSIHTI